MSAKIRLPGPEWEATVTDWEWTADDPSFEDTLQAMLPPGGPGGEDPNPDHTAAMMAVEQLGAILVSYDRLEYVEGRVY